MHVTNRALETSRGGIIGGGSVRTDLKPSIQPFARIGERNFILQQFQRPVGKRRLLDMADAELGQHAGNIIEEHPVRRKNNHFLRFHLIAVLVEEER